jgi:sugar/nucleoside kinase (ribokinase family)
MPVSGPFGKFVPDLLIVGAASRDLTADDPRGWRLGGAVSYCSLTAARLGLRVGCLIGLDRPARDAAELELLEEAGVIIEPVPLASGPVFENVEAEGHRRQRWISTSDPVPPAALPTSWRRASGWLLAPVAGELPEEWAAAVGAAARVGLGWQGLLREFGGDGWVERVPPAPSPLLDRAGLVCVSADDLDPATELAGLRGCAGSATVVVTAGDAGGVALGRQRPLRYSALRAAEVVDATGAGDVFLAALMAVWLTSGELATARALRLAAAAGSLAVEGAGLAGVPAREAITARLRGPARTGDGAGSQDPAGG